MTLPRLPLAAALAVAAFCAPTLARAQAAPAGTSPPPAPAASPAPAPAGNPVVARVGDQVIHASDVAATMQSLPPQLRRLPQQVLYPMVLGRLVDEAALVAEARKQGLEKDPAVAAAMKTAADRTLQSALLQKEVGPDISDAAVHAQYQKQYAGKQGPRELHARHILVKTKPEADAIIAKLKAGGKFSTLAKEQSTDTGSKATGGDLGWFKEGDMVPAFSKAAFALKPGEVSPQPVHTEFGWHVIQVLGDRRSPPPSFASVQEQIRHDLINKGIAQAITKAKADVKITTYNANGSPHRATDNATPPPASGATGAPAPAKP